MADGPPCLNPANGFCFPRDAQLLAQQELEKNAQEKAYRDEKNAQEKAYRARAQLLADQERDKTAQQEVHRARQLALEQERARLEQLQLSQLEQTEFVLEQQRHYINDEHANRSELDGCDVSILQCGSGPPRAQKNESGALSRFFSAEI